MLDKQVNERVTRKRICNPIGWFYPLQVPDPATKELCVRNIRFWLRCQESRFRKQLRSEIFVILVLSITVVILVRR
jgi:hypothetical protein